MATIRDFQVNNGLEVNLNANVANVVTASDYFVNSNMPTALPSLLVDFRSSQQLDSRITLQRSTTATYLSANGTLLTANANQPRFPYANGVCQGLLIEEPRTNLYPWGNFLDTMVNTGNFTGAAGSFTIIPGGSPAGTDCVQIVNNANPSYNSHYLFEWNGTVSLNANEKVTWSVFIKPMSTDAAMQDNIGLRFWTGGGRAWTTDRYTYFNLLTGTKSFTGGTIDDYSITPYPNGWFRLSMSATTDQAGSGAFSVYLQNYTPNVTSYQVWGGQFERGLFATSYIPTNGASATRASDIVYIPTSNNVAGNTQWYNPTQGTFAAEFVPLTPGGPSGYSGYPQFVSLVGTDPDNAIMGTYWAAVSAQRQMSILNYNATVVGSVTTALFQNVDNIIQTPSQITGAVNTAFKSAITYTANTFNGAVNGSVAFSPTDATTTGTNATFVRLNLCQQGRYQYQPSSYFRKLAYYPSTVNVAQLQYMTS